MHEKQVSYDPANMTFTAQIFHVEKLPLDPSQSFAVYKVVPIDDNSCKFVMSMTYQTDPKFMGKLAKGNFKKKLADYLLAVEHHAATGENVNKDNFKQIKKQYKS